MTAISTSEPIRRTRQAQAAVGRAEEQLARARAALHAALADALRAGVRQNELVRATGLSRETVRRAARGAGLEPERPAS